MAGESQELPKTGAPDPSVRAMEQIALQITSLGDLTDAKFDIVRERLDGVDAATKLRLELMRDVPARINEEVNHLRELIFERLGSVLTELSTREEYRKELKADSKEALTTAMTAAEKAVTAALAAAEKARDQQTIASQLATDKASTQFVESLSQQQATFTVAISGLGDRFSVIGQQLAEMRAERRAGAAHTSNIYAAISTLAAVVAIAAFVMTYAAR